MIAFILFDVLYLWAFWAAYVLTMGLYRAHLSGRLTGLNKWLAFPVVMLAALMDCLANCTFAWLLFWEPPRETLVTQRLIRYKGQHFGWRYVVACYVCDKLLDVFDPTGDHC